jgi:hypothetical protein
MMTGDGRISFPVTCHPSPVTALLLVFVYVYIFGVDHVIVSAG